MTATTPDGNGAEGRALPPFALTYDYRCPFARNGHEHVVQALRAGAGWDVTFTPFSLSQVHVEEGGTPVWEDPGAAPALLAIEAGLVVQTECPERFLDVHLALFTARHDEARDLREESVVRDVLEQQGVPADDVLRLVAEGAARQRFRAAHEAAVERGVFGVPTFMTDDQAVFVRVMTRPRGDADLARSTIERIVRLIVDHPELNEFKHTTIPR